MCHPVYHSLVTELFNKALTSKLVICEDGLWDDNPDKPLHCIGMFDFIFIFALNFFKLSLTRITIILVLNI